MFSSTSPMSPEPCRSQGLAASLPNELLTTILRGSLPPIMDEDGRVHFQLLRMVCSRWREVCFSTPAFWSSIAVETSFETPEINTYLELMRGWFSRAGGSMSLSLVFDDKVYEREDMDDDFVLFIQSYQKRWRYLCLDIDTKPFWRLLKACPVNLWLNLRHLSVAEHLISTLDFENETEDVHVKDHPLEDSFPGVKQFTLRSPVIPPGFTYPVGRNTVKTLTWNADRVEGAYYQPFLSQYRHLTHLEIDCVRDTIYWPADEPNPISLNALTYFSFTASPWESNWRFLGEFRTPSLVELVLTSRWKLIEDEIASLDFDYETPRVGFHCSMQGMDSLPPAIQPFLESCSNGTLTRFSLKGSIPPQLFQRIVVLVPGSVTSLYLQYWPYDVFGLTCLDYKPPSMLEGKFFPKLDSLRIAEIPSSDFLRPQTTRSVKSLVSFLSKRVENANSHARLTSLGVTRGKVKRSLDCFPDTELEGLKKKGLNVVVWVEMAS
ncbi:hypothetical protein BKA70DRAFT_1578870 [Coprinopsis sp. MPI-PUGE-AT-0042]|nr:hypothetical protein BKA70DRAFT_1578870 [Coprinopsis sp. MPI-PUGE-AT-0042]